MGHTQGVKDRWNISDKEIYYKAKNRIGPLRYMRSHSRQFVLNKIIFPLPYTLRPSKILVRVGPGLGGDRQRADPYVSKWVKGLQYILYGGGIIGLRIDRHPIGI